MEFTKAYAVLNTEQKQAVDTIDGPLLVLAGPGTGKTQLLSARVANILQKTDTLPQSILCLTFTDAAALNMRERLASMIGEAAYDVHINTYHSFASDIIRSYPDFFESVDIETGEDSRMTRPIDELRQLDIITTIIQSLPFDDPLYNTKHYVKSVLGTISDLKQAVLSPNDVRKIAKENESAIESLSPQINDILAGMARIPKHATALPLFENVHSVVSSQEASLAQMAARELEQALNEASELRSTKPLTAWKNSWLHKDERNNWDFTNPHHTQKLYSLAYIYEQYQNTLQKHGEYDFNDMINRTIEVMRSNNELRYNLQETYQYVLLDEFQDTNAAQFQLVQELVSHPVHEGRPNVMAVGDDDQGIFAFQGADIGNMVQFIGSFRDVKIINLTKNYRSHHDILHVAHNIAGQIESRLHHNLEGISKDIEAAANDLPDEATITRHEFASQANEYGWIAEKVKSLINDGTAAKDIAVLAPKHKILEELVPFLNASGIPVTYEKREDILHTPLVQSLLLVSRFIVAAHDQHFDLMDELLPQVLSLEFWNIKTETIWTLNWECYRHRFTNDAKPYFICALEEPSTQQPTEFLLTLSKKFTTTPLETMFDYIIGSQDIQLDDGTNYTSPFKEFYFSEEMQKATPQAFYEAISHLSVIRAQLRDQQSSAEKQLKLDHFLHLYNIYQEAEEPLINTHPIAQNADSVQLQTVYKAKGLEYEYVFLPCMHDDVWGSSSSSTNNKISLPANLNYIRHDGSTEDTKRRLLYVAVTRAKCGLFATSYAQKDSGKKTVPVKYFQESEDENKQRVSNIFPEAFKQVIVTSRNDVETRQDVLNHWFTRHGLLTPSLHSLLTERLAHYRMSPTHLNTFTSLEYTGPQTFLMGTLLRFPEAQTADSIYGSALHACLEWLQKEGWNKNQWHTSDEVVHYFTSLIKQSYLADKDKEKLIERGTKTLTLYLKNNLKRFQTVTARAEIDFSKEGVVLGDAILTGKIDRLEINEDDKTLKIIDFKSGQAATKWASSSKLLNYKQQLYFYMLLIEKSHTYKDYTVTSAELEFIEPLNGKIVPPLTLVFDQKEYDELKQLIQAVWAHIQALNLPDVSTYAKSVAGTKQFIKDLLK